MKLNLSLLVLNMPSFLKKGNKLDHWERIFDQNFKLRIWLHYTMVNLHQKSVVFSVVLKILVSINIIQWFRIIAIKNLQHYYLQSSILHVYSQKLLNIIRILVHLVSIQDFHSCFRKFLRSLKLSIFGPR